MSLLFFHPSVSALALQVSERSSVPLGQIEWGSFADGWPDLFIHDVEAIRQQRITFLASFQSPASVVEQFAVIEAIPRYFAASLQVVLPFFPVGTMERIDRNGEVATAATLSRLLSSVSPCRPGGPMLVTTFDIHALQQRFYFGDSVIPDLRSAVPLLRAELSRLSLPAPAIAFPDDGARKRFARMFEDYPVVLCDKRRQQGQRRVVIQEGEPEGKSIVLVDDLIQTGGTLVEAARALLEAGAESVSAFATHGVLPDDSWRRFDPELFERVWITDSCPDAVEAVRGHKPFEVLSLAPLIADSLESPTTTT